MMMMIRNQSRETMFCIAFRGNAQHAHVDDGDQRQRCQNGEGEGVVDKTLWMCLWMVRTHAEERRNRTYTYILICSANYYL